MGFSARAAVLSSAAGHEAGYEYKLPTTAGDLGRRHTTTQLEDTKGNKTANKKWNLEKWYPCKSGEGRNSAVPWSFKELGITTFLEATFL